MNKMNIPKNFYCDSEQFKHLEIFKTKVNLINKYYTEEVQELLFANSMTDYTEYMFSSSEDIIEKLFKDDTVKFIDYIYSDIDLNNKTQTIEFNNFKRINELKLTIDDGLISENTKIKEGWALVKIDLDQNEKQNKYFLKELQLLPTYIEEEDMNYFFSLREKYSLSDWINLILGSLGFSSANLTFKEKYTLLARAIPFCQENFSLLELGSKGTGKSTFYEDFRNNKIGVYTGSPTAANLFYNNQGKGTPGAIIGKDVLVIDEVNNMTFDEEVYSNFKSYLEKDFFNRGKEDIPSDCSIVFLGNYDNFHEAHNNPEKILSSLKNKFFQETAIIDRFSFISYGWEVKLFSKSKNIPEKRFLQTYLIKIFQKLRKHDFSKLIEDKIDFHKDLGDRHTKNIIKFVSGLLKLLHPNQVVRDKELIAYIEIAVENFKYKTNIKRYIENYEYESTGKRKSEFKIPSPIYIPKNEVYKDKIDIINKEFILYNYMDLFKSNYSLKDFVIIANEFDSDNGINTSINFFPINQKTEKKKEVKLIGDVLTVDHPYIDNERLNIAISLTGAYENENRVNFYNNLKELNKYNQFSPLINFDELGHNSNDFILLSSKKNIIGGSLFTINNGFVTLKDQNTHFYYNINKNYYIPYYPKNIYLSSDFNFNNLYENYSNFRIIESFNPNIQILSINYLIEKEQYEIQYNEINSKAPVLRAVTHIQMQQGNQLSINNYQNLGFTQPAGQLIPTSIEPTKGGLFTIDEFIDLIKEKN